MTCVRCCPTRRNLSYCTTCTVATWWWLYGSSECPYDGSYNQSFITDLWSFGMPLLLAYPHRINVELKLRKSCPAQTDTSTLHTVQPVTDYSTVQCYLLLYYNRERERERAIKRARMKMDLQELLNFNRLLLQPVQRDWIRNITNFETKLYFCCGSVCCK
jgi:hypothetical protein